MEIEWEYIYASCSFTEPGEYCTGDDCCPTHYIPIQGIKIDIDAGCPAGAIFLMTKQNQKSPAEIEQEQRARRQRWEERISEKQSQEDQGTAGSTKNIFLLLLHPQEFDPNVGFLRLYQTPLSIAFAVMVATFAALFLFFGDQQEISVMLIITAMPALLAAMLTRHWFTECRRMKSLYLNADSSGKK